MRRYNLSTPCIGDAAYFYNEKYAFRRCGYCVRRGSKTNLTSAILKRFCLARRKLRFSMSNFISGETLNCALEPCGAPPNCGLALRLRGSNGRDFESELSR